MGPNGGGIPIAGRYLTPPNLRRGEKWPRSSEIERRQRIWNHFGKVGVPGRWESNLRDLAAASAAGPIADEHRHHAGVSAGETQTAGAADSMTEWREKAYTVPT